MIPLRKMVDKKEHFALDAHRKGKLFLPEDQRGVGPWASDLDPPVERRCLPMTR